MKLNVLLLAFTFSGIMSFAQKPLNNLQLAKGQQITVTTSTLMDTDMGMGISMKNEMSQKNTLVVTGITDEIYTVSNTVNQVKLTGNMAGTAIDFDSDKPEDLNSEIGATLKDRIGKTTYSNINRKTALVETKPEEKQVVDIEIKAGNPISDLMTGPQANMEDNISGAFFIIPAGKKQGDVWVDSNTVDKMKTVTRYLFKSADKNLVTIDVNTIIDGTNSMEAQGMQMEFVMNSKATGEIVVDKTTSLVKKRTANAELTGSIEMMGQSMPVSSKSTSITEYK